MSWPKVDVILNAIKNSSSQTITDLKPTIDGIKTNFDEWKVPWTAERAGNLDYLDVPVSTRASEVTVNNIQDNATLTLEKVRQLFPAGASETFTTPGTYTFKVPAGVGIVKILCVGAGGGGGGGSAKTSGEARAGGGGGGGGKREGTISVTAGTNLTVVVGAGGKGGAGTTGTGETGGTGGSSSVGGIIATGGSGGTGGVPGSSGGKGGAGGILDGFPGTGASSLSHLYGEGGPSPSTHGSYGRGGNGGRGADVSGTTGKVGSTGLDGFVMISY